MTKNNLINQEPQTKKNNYTPSKIPFFKWFSIIFIICLIASSLWITIYYVKNNDPQTQNDHPKNSWFYETFYAKKEELLVDYSIWGGWLYFTLHTEFNKKGHHHFVYTWENKDNNRIEFGNNIKTYNNLVKYIYKDHFKGSFMAYSKTPLKIQLYIYRKNDGNYYFTYINIQEYDPNPTPPPNPPLACENKAFNSSLF